MTNVEVLMIKEAHLYIQRSPSFRRSNLL